MAGKENEKAREGTVRQETVSQGKKARKGAARQGMRRQGKGRGGLILRSESCVVARPYCVVCVVLAVSHCVWHFILFVIYKCEHHFQRSVKC
jgi:hypothetical protein